MPRCRPNWLRPQRTSHFHGAAPARTGCGKAEPNSIFRALRKGEHPQEARVSERIHVREKATKIYAR
jgi:hypothetical protein